MNQELNASQMGQWKHKENHHQGDTKRLTAFFDGEVDLVDILFSDEEVKPVLSPEQQVFVSELQTSILSARKTMVENQQQTTVEMPASAGSFDIVDTQGQESFSLPDFNSLLVQYSDSIFYATVNDILTSVSKAIGTQRALLPLNRQEEQYKDLSSREWNEVNEDAWKIKKIVEDMSDIPVGVTNARETYVTFAEKAAPELRVCVDRLNSLAEEDLSNDNYKGECFIGHGADALYWATIASRWKTKLATKTYPVKVDIGSAFLKKDYYTQKYSDQLSPVFRDSIVRMLQRLGVRADGRFIDTGFYGSVPAALIRALDPHMQIVSPEEVNEHIKLMRKAAKTNGSGSSRFSALINQMTLGIEDQSRTNGRDTTGIEELGSQTPQGKDIMEVILEGDASPRVAESPTKMIRVETAPGEFLDDTENIHTSPSERIRAYAAQQAVIREFLPRTASSLGEITQDNQSSGSVFSRLRQIYN